MKENFENSCGNKIERHVLCCVLFTSSISVAEFIYFPMSGDVINMNGSSRGPIKKCGELRKKLVKIYQQRN